MRVLEEKYLLKQAAKGWIPESIRKRHKQPYRAPDGRSFFGPQGDYLEAMLSPEKVKRDGIFKAPAVDALVRKFRRQLPTSTADTMALLGILSTEILLDQFMGRSPHNSVAYETAAP